MDNTTDTTTDTNDTNDIISDFTDISEISPAQLATIPITTNYVSMMTNAASYFTYTILNKLNLGYIANYIYMDKGAKICKGLYIGSLSTAQSRDWIRVNKIDCVLNLSGFGYPCDVPVVSIDMQDMAVSLDRIDDYIAKFAIGKRVIKKCLDDGKSILVHCAAGINRSAATICFYLIDIGYSYDQCVKILTIANSKRNTSALTNITFRYLLRTYAEIKKI